MPIRIDTDAGSNLRLTTFSGRITDAELIAYADELRAGFDPTVNAVIDARSCELSLSSSGIRAIAETMQTPPVGAGARRVAIIAPDDLAYGFARMYQSLHSSPASVRVFREYADGYRWAKDGGEAG